MRIRCFHQYPFHFNLKSAHFNGTVDSLSDDQFFNCLSMCDPTLPFMEKRARYPKVSFLIFPIFAGLMGYLYGFIISGIWVLSMPGLNFWIYYANGILFDTYHALGNIAFWILLIPIFERLNPFEKLKK